MKNLLVQVAKVKKLISDLNCPEVEEWQEVHPIVIPTAPDQPVASNYIERLEWRLQDNQFDINIFFNLHECSHDMLELTDFDKYSLTDLFTALRYENCDVLKYAYEFKRLIAQITSELYKIEEEETDLLTRFNSIMG